MNRSPVTPHSLNAGWWGWQTAAVLAGMIALLVTVVGCSGRGSAETPQASVTAQPAQQSVKVTDIVGRQVTLQAPVRTMILSEARILYVVSPLEPSDPFRRIAGWADDLRVNDFDTYQKYREKFPQVVNIPVFGSAAQGQFSVEKAIDVNPDVVVLTYDSYTGARGTGLIEKLEAAGIPVIVIDFRQQPLENTIPSLMLMGRVMGTEERAQRLADYYTEQVNMVYSRLEKVKQEKPDAFIYRAAGLLDCCATFGNGNMGLMIDRAGGANLGTKFLPSWSGVLNPEQVLASNPDVIIVTGSNWKNSRPEGGFVPLGYNTANTTAQKELRDLVSRTPGWSNLDAVKQNRVHAIWHQFYISPYHFVTLLEFAKWMYPQEFGDVDMQEVYRDFHSRFLPVEYSGTFFTSIQ